MLLSGITDTGQQNTGFDHFKVSGISLQLTSLEQIEQGETNKRNQQRQTSEERLCRAA